MVKLGVNIDHVATIRQARREEDPDPVMAALICEKSGAHSIVAHLREDRRHIQDRDVLVLKKAIKTRFNLEMSLYPDIVDIASALKPHQVTIVPERRQEITTEGGLDVMLSMSKLKRASERLRKNGTEISVFIAPDKKQILASYDIGIRMLEFHTGAYAKNFANRQAEADLRKIMLMTEFACKKGMIVNAGHGLNYDNVRPIAKIEGMNELNIGHSIISRAVFVGLDRAVKEMVLLLR